MGETATRVLVTDAHATSALSVVRSLGSRGMRITTAGEQGRFNLASHSRYVERSFVWPPAAEEPGGYLQQLVSELTRTPYDLLLPMTDTTLTIVRHRREAIERLVRLALPSNETLAAAQDKAATMRIAEQVGVRTPKTWICSSIREVENVAPTLSYPCVIKPRRSCQWSGSGRLIRDTARYVHSADALRRFYAARDRAPEDLLVQELVHGGGIGVFALTDAGRPLAVFAHRRVREANPTGGRASLAESIAPDDRLLDPALRLLSALEWTGVAMVEFKDPGPPEPPILMEVNGRFWGSLPLAIAAGVDFPFLLTQLMLGHRTSTSSSYKVGVRCRHMRGDLSYLAAALKGRPPHWHGAYPTRLGAMAAISPWPGRWASYNLRADDPMPAIREAGHVIVTELMRLCRSGASDGAA